MNKVMRFVADFHQYKAGQTVMVDGDTANAAFVSGAAVNTTDAPDVIETEAVQSAPENRASTKAPATKVKTAAKNSTKKSKTAAKKV